MVYRIDNRKKKHYGRYTALGLIMGIVLALGGVYVYENYRQPILDNVSDIVKENTPKPEKPREVKHIRPVKQLSADDIAQQIHSLINQEREKNRLTPLLWSDSITNIAKSHSDYMIKNNDFTHNGVTDRLNEMGCPNGSENLNFGEFFNLDNISQRMVDAWMGSEGHRVNILNPSFSSEGIGITINGHIIVATEDFC